MPESGRDLAGKRVLITGATGFIGAHLAARLAREMVEVHALARPGGDQRRVATLSGRVRLWYGDVMDAESVRLAVAAARPDVVFHLAADTGVRRLHQGWAGVTRSLRANLEGTLTVLQATLEAHHPVTSFIRLGGLEEYGDGPIPADEEQRERPISPYSASQVAATHFTQMIQRGTDVPIVTLRPVLIYGPGQSSDFFIPSLIGACLRGEDFDMTMGTQRRDLLYVDDLVEALVRAATTAGLHGAVINLGHGVEHSVREVAQLIVSLSGTSARLRFGMSPERPRDLQHLVTRTDRAAALLNWRPDVSLPDGLARTISWYRDGEPRRPLAAAGADGRR